MKPDKHKKKHHAAYAKKAAQKNKKNGKTSIEIDETGSHSHRSQYSKDIGLGLPEHKFQPEGLGSKVRDEFNRNSSEDEDTLTSFSRRKIESNWQQYHELPDEEEIVEHRGADFMLLLAQTAGSQFRFKDEETLDEDTTQEDPSSVLSFDCNELAKKLQTISLPERLEISRTVFDSEMLEILDQDAATSKTLTNRQINTTGEQSLPSSNKPEEVTNFDHELEDILARSQMTDQAVINQSIQADQDPSVVSTSRLQSSSVFQEEEADKETCEEGLISSNFKPHSVSNSGITSSNLSADDELDFLLSMRSPIGNESHHSRTEDETQDISRPKEEVPAPLSLHNDNAQEVNNVLSKPSQNSTVESADAQTESLDDWLDAILDD